MSYETVGATTSASGWQTEWADWWQGYWSDVSYLPTQVKPTPGSEVTRLVERPVDSVPAAGDGR